VRLPLVIRARDIGCPRSVSDADFEEICSTFKIPPQERTNLRWKLDNLVEVFAEALKKSEQLPDRKDDRKAVKRALSHIRKARTEFSKPRGHAAQKALGAFRQSIGSMVSARWLRDNFPTNPLVPQPKEPPEPRGPRGEISRRLRSERYDIEDFSMWERIGFVGDHPLETIGAVLSAVDDAIESALDNFTFLPGAKGGRRPLTFRHYFLINLAELWHDRQGQVLVGQRSEFVTFCEAVLEAIGWPTDGSVSAVADAVKDWRNRHQKLAR
jgi:hypothetical protein